MAITSWTSEGMVWDTLENKRLYPYIEAIRLALIERATVAGVALSSVLTTPIASGVIPKAADGGSFGTLFQAAVTNLIGYFINQTDNGGNWTNVPSTSSTANIIPDWTEADILTSIGAASRLGVGGDKLFSKEWILQQYQILNKLVWTKTGTNNIAFNMAYQKSSGWQADYTTAVAAFNAASWTTSGATLNSSHFLDISGSQRLIIRNYLDVALSNWSTTYKHSMDIYVRLTGIDGGVNAYEDNDWGTTYPGSGKYTIALIHQETTPFQTSTYNYPIAGNFDTPSVTDGTALKGWYGYDKGLGGIKIVVLVNKWNVVDGFQFQ